MSQLCRISSSNKLLLQQQAVEEDEEKQHEMSVTIMAGRRAGGSMDGWTIKRRAMEIEMQRQLSRRGFVTIKQTSPTMMSTVKLRKNNQKHVPMLK